jgi:Asp/Glu/hydantoin racemase
MKILVANPNTTAAVTDRLVTVGRRVAAPGTDLVGLTAPRGVPYIASRAEAQIGGAVLLEMLADHLPGCDAAIVAAFGDPGLGGARELFEAPVVGLAEAAMVTALMLGRRFAVVTFAQALEAWYEETIDAYGLGARSAGVFCADRAFASLTTVGEEMADALVELSARAVGAGADVVILGGAPISGVAAAIGDRIPVPCVDPISAAVAQAEALVRLAPAKARAGTFRRPQAKSSIGLAPALAARIGHTEAAPR